MPKRISQNELDTVIRAVAGFPEGARVEEIRGALGDSVPRRTLQRWLALLVEQKRIIVEGRTRASRYRLPVITTEEKNNLPGIKVEVRGEVYVPISSEGKALRQAVRAPIQNRHPVGYNRAFLDAYKPNDRFYLSAKNRQHLHEMGGSPEGQHLAGTYARQIINRLLIDLSWNSSRLEGNTYSLL